MNKDSKITGGITSTAQEDNAVEKLILIAHSWSYQLSKQIC